MSNHNYCHSSFPAHILQKLQDCFSRLIIQRACRLKPSQRRSWILGKSPGYRHTLFAARLLKAAAGKFPSLSLQPHIFQNCCRIQRFFTNLKSQFYVFQSCEIGHQIIKLKYKTNILSPIPICLLEYFAISTPSTSTCPEVALSIPPRMFSTVVFPAPLGPTTTTNSTLLISKLMWSTATIFTSRSHKPLTHFQALHMHDPDAPFSSPAFCCMIKRNPCLRDFFFVCI